MVFTVEVSHADALSRVIAQVARVPGVERARRR
jgi:(p)ppGpp synthase/HD superfamily hydrolase